MMKKDKNILHYTGCGLDNVYLEGGFTIRNTPYGEGVSIHDLEGLHKVIAYNLCTEKRKLKGEEIRFLRKELELSQVELASLLDVSESTMRGWENNRNEISGSANILIRAIYLEKAGQNKKISKLIELIRKIDNERKKITLTEIDNTWTAAAA